jgi:hypothetical protein
MNRTIVIALWALSMPGAAEDIGNLSANPFVHESTANPFDAGSRFAPNGINNPFRPYGSPFSNKSATNPCAIDAPRLSLQYP